MRRPWETFAQRFDSADGKESQGIASLQYLSKVIAGIHVFVVALIFWRSG